MFQLIYASTAARRMEEAELRTLVERARDRNDERGITGVLVHRNGSFLHVIEGIEEEARALYKHIRGDDRHHWITLLKASPVEQRDFPDAPLAFRDRSEAGARHSGRLDAPAGASTEDALAGDGGLAHETLLQFQRANGRGEAAPGGGNSGDSPASPRSRPGPADYGSASEAAAS